MTSGARYGAFSGYSKPHSGHEINNKTPQGPVITDLPEIYRTCQTRRRADMYKASGQSSGCHPAGKIQLKHKITKPVAAIQHFSKLIIRLNKTVDFNTKDI